MSRKYDVLKSILGGFTKEELQTLSFLDLGLTEDDLISLSPDHRNSEKFLDIYTEDYIEEAFKKYGIFSLLEEKGFENLKIILDTQNTDRQRLAIYFENTNNYDNLLCEIILKRKIVKLDFTFNTFFEDKEYNFLIVEWLYSQNPLKKFTNNRKRLPGQKHPGLNMARNVLKLLLIVARKKGFDGILNIPEHYHNAQLYSKYFSYLSPLNEAKRRAIERDLLSKYDLSTVSWAIYLDCVSENNNSFRWFIAEQIIGLNKDIINYFSSEKYENYVSKYLSDYTYTLNIDKWESVKKDIENYICI